MDLLEVVTAAWSFTGLAPRRVIDVNRFGNLLVEATDGRVWRICPEELKCEPIEGSVDELRGSLDWTMVPLVEAATALLGEPGVGRCFCLKQPAVLGGEYDESNFGTIALAELIAFSGDLAQQIADVPDGTYVELRVK